MNPAWIAEAAGLIISILKAMDAHNAPPSQQAQAISQFTAAINTAVTTKDPTLLENLLGVLTSPAVAAGLGALAPSMLDSPDQATGRNAT